VSAKRWPRAKGENASGQIVHNLKGGESVPAGDPLRIPTTDGYVMLRWKVALYEYVQVLEHRVRGGVVVPDDVVVHHRDHDKTNNDPSNLEQLTRGEHSVLHLTRLDVDRVISLYVEGYSQQQVADLIGASKAGVKSVLRRAGVPARRGVNQWNGRLA